jgi:hypothetical protein
MRRCAVAASGHKGAGGPQPSRHKARRAHARRAPPAHSTRMAQPASPTPTTSTAMLTLAGRVRRAASALKRGVVCLGKRRAPHAKTAATFDIVAGPDACLPQIVVTTSTSIDVAPAVLVAPPSGPHKIRRKPVPAYDASAPAAPRVPASLDAPKPTPSRTLEVPPTVHRIRRKPVPAYDATPVARPALLVKPPLPPRDSRRRPTPLALEDAVPRIVVICDEGTIVADSASDVHGPPSPFSDDVSTRFLHDVVQWLMCSF